MHALPRFGLLLTTSLILLACAAKPAPPFGMDGDDPFKGGGSALNSDGRWIPPEDVRAAGESQSGSYEAAPRWRGPDGCSGQLRDGTRDLGRHLLARFDGLSRFEGYNCRQNTADRTQTSMHGTGRALDIYVPLNRGAANNALGDEVAHYLIENASYIGVQLIIWDRTKWNVSYSGRKDREYGGSHPHHDHLHIELSGDGSAGRTAFFETPAEAPAEAPEAMPERGSDAPIGTMGCQDFCPYARDGECDDGGPGAAYALCDLGTDCSDCGVRTVDSSDACDWSGWRCSDASDARQRCEAGRITSTETCSSVQSCVAWGDGTDACVSRAVPVDENCTDACPYANDGVCDDGGEGAAYSVCALGSDCADCGDRSAGAAPEARGLCLEGCVYSSDGECDDGGPGAVTSLCELGSDCVDCGPRGVVSPSTPEAPRTTSPHAGLTLESMEIPRSGLANSYLEPFGYSTEPLGTVVTHEGRSYVRGTVSWFGGPSDRGVSSTETGAVTGERLRSLNDPVSPDASTLSSRPEDYYFIAMRWNYRPQGVRWLRSARILLVNPDTGTSIVVRPVDWGPHPRTGRTVDISPEALDALGLRTDQNVLVAWAGSGTALGPSR